MTLKGQTGVPWLQILSIEMACRCKCASEVEVYPYLAAYVE